MMGRLMIATAMVIITIALFPVITNTLQNAQSNITSTPSPISEDLVQMLDWVPWIFGGLMLFIVIAVVYRALSSSGLDGVEGGGDDEDEDDEDDEDEDEDYDDEDEDEDEDEEDEPEPRMNTKKHSTTVTTTKRTGEKKMNVTIGPGYNVDKYALDKPSDTKLTIKEEEFKKTKFD